MCNKIKDDIWAVACGICKMDGRALDPMEAMLAGKYEAGELSKADWLLRLRKHSKVYESGSVAAREQSEYCYPDSGVLVNRLNLSDAGRLAAVENAVVTQRVYELLAQPKVVINQFGVNTMSRLHAFLFGDLYGFSGQLRTEDLVKGRVKFCAKENIKPSMAKVTSYISRNANFAIDDLGKFVQHVTAAHHAMNSIHPFRKGNGRTMRLFLTLMAWNAGFSLDYGLIEPEVQLEADKAAVAGSTTALAVVYSQITSDYSGSFEVEFAPDGEKLPPLAKVLGK